LQESLDQIAPQSQYFRQLSRSEQKDIRAGMAMLLAALAAEGSSTIHNVGQIERGYERIDERLRALGADIQRADG
jgi:UDP-N-acetylglucosamine 1-carboxyvinyltransferase